MLNIYLTDLAAYNSGYLIGKWITLPLDEYSLKQELNEVLTLGSNALMQETEEYFITDYEWSDINLFPVDEYENLDELNSKLLKVKEFDKYTLKAIKYLLWDAITDDLEDAINKAEDVRIYENMTMEDLAYEIFQDSTDLDELPSLIANNIDFKGNSQRPWI